MELYRATHILKAIGSMFMDGEINISVVGRHLMTVLQESQTNQSVSRTIPQSSLQSPTVNLETACVEVLRLLDQSSREDSSTADAVLHASNAGQTLLHISASLGFECLTKELLVRGMDPDQRDANGFAALHFAALYGHINCAELLVHEGADIQLIDIWHRTAQQVALESNHGDVAAFLESFSVNINDFVNGVSDNRNSKEQKVSLTALTFSLCLPARISPTVSCVCK